ncbi:MAG: hypothetical protein R2822_05890 [Spirosomataceae bacterium]
MNIRNLLLFLGFTAGVFACQRPANDVLEAKERITQVKRWQIQEILMDEVPVFKQGKHIPHISGVQFDKYMDWVQFKADGSFEGHFKDATDTQVFQWQADERQMVIILSDTLSKTGGWYIYPRDVYEDSFAMESRSTVYDPPRLTKLTLKFRKKS